MGGREIVR
jgi:hypothetical protein